jgi:hypothetical protein
MNLRFCFAFLIIELQPKGGKLSDLHSIVLKVNLPKKAPMSATNFHISTLAFQIYFYCETKNIMHPSSQKPAPSMESLFNFIFYELRSEIYLESSSTSAACFFHKYDSK